MGMKRFLFVILLLVFALSLNSCSDFFGELSLLYYSIIDFNTADIDITKISVERADLSYSHAYFLSTDNVLYSLGALPDVHEYVYYANQRKGIVAENVKDFGTSLGGGFYITSQNELYIWNIEKIPELGYSKNRSSQKILEGVIQADSGFDSVLYIDECGRLCIIGTFNEIVYSPDDPYVMAEDAVRFDVPGGPFTIKGAYVKNDGKIEFFGSGMEDYPYYSSIQNLSFENPETVKMDFWNNYCLILENGRLHFYGDYSIIDGNEEPNEVDNVILLDNVTCFSYSDKLITAVDESGDGYVFGECISNGLDNVEKREYEYCEKKKIISDVKNVCVSGQHDICFVDKTGNTQSFRYDDTFGFFGNSTDDMCVGINREPVTWE